MLIKMEDLNGKTFHPNIHSAMDGWLDSVRKVQARRKEEIINATNRHRSGAPRNHDERGERCCITSLLVTICHQHLVHNCIAISISLPFQTGKPSSNLSFFVDVIALAAAIAELSETCRRARTSLWCALQMSWKPGFIPLGVMSKRAEVVAREKQALREQQQLVAAHAVALNRSASASSSTSSLPAAGSVSSSQSLSSCSLGSPVVLPLATSSSIGLLSDHMSHVLANSAGFNLSLPIGADGNNNLHPLPSEF